MEYKTPIVIAEIGCNHMGDMEIAKQMITTAKTFSNVGIVKFQKRNPKELLSEEQYNAPHPNPHNSYGDTYGKHREFLEFTAKQHKELKRFCDRLKIEYSCSVWDLTSAKEIAALKPKLIKVGSPSNLKFDVLDYLAKHYDGEIHIALGMTTRKEEKQIVAFMRKVGRLKDVVLYACTSGYPVPFEDVSLLEITRLKKTYGKEVKAIGFSGHHLSIAIDVAAYTLGATYIERHYTLDNTWKGTDHAASLEPGAMRKLVRNLLATQKALTFKKKEILDIEKPQREKLKNYIPS